MPVPERGTLCGDPGASSGIETVPLKGPVAVGAKSTWIVQNEPAATAVLEQVSDTIANGAPTATAPTFSVSVPLFVTVSGWLADLVPTTWLPKATLDVDSVTAG